MRSRGIALAAAQNGALVGACPFHPSAGLPTFRVKGGSWRCEACGREGAAAEFLQAHDGISLRHARELLTSGELVVFSLGLRVKRSTVRRLPCPLDPEADDGLLLDQVAAYYHQRLMESNPARTFLNRLGLDREDVLTHFRIGYADRSLGLRLPEKNRKHGRLLRSRLRQLGLWRTSGHEHFNGCIVVPLHGLVEAASKITGFCGLKLASGPLTEVHTAGPQRGVFNPDAFEADEIILCQTVFDALRFWTAGCRNATSLLGNDFSEEVWAALRHVRCVRIAYRSDEAGDRAAERDAARFQAHGIEVYHLTFPPGMGAMEFASHTPADQSPDHALQRLVHGARWLGVGAQVLKSHSSDDQAPDMPPGSQPAANAERGESDPAAKLAEGTPASLITCHTPTTQGLTRDGDGWLLSLNDRQYRIGGLEKVLGTDDLKVTVRLHYRDSAHLDRLDLSRDANRRRFIERASEETGLTADLLRRDLGKVLLAVELAKATLDGPAPQITDPLSPKEHAEALDWLRAPGLIQRLCDAFHRLGLVGEDTDSLLIYLAGVSRKLERPLSILVQSDAASGKSKLLDTVLSLFPEEECVRCSARQARSDLEQAHIGHKILALRAEPGSDAAAIALISQRIPVALLVASTAAELDEELQSRCWTIALDESAEHTEHIQVLQRHEHMLDGLMAREECRRFADTLRNAQRLLASVPVINPYATALTFPTSHPRYRRDHERYLTLIDAIALLHQHQRPRKRQLLADGSVEFIEATLDDIALANQLTAKALAGSSNVLPPQTRCVLRQIAELLKQKRQTQPATRTFGRRELCDHCGLSLTQIRFHLRRLVELDYLSVRGGRLGSQLLYEAQFDLDAPEGSIGLTDVESLRGIDSAHGDDPNLAGVADAARQV
jgi:DNA primase